MWDEVWSFVAAHFCCFLTYRCTLCRFVTSSYVKFSKHLETHVEEEDVLLEKPALFFDEDAFKA